MTDEHNGCRPAAGILGIDANSVDCEKCPFPFCVATEANILRSELKEHVARILQNLGDSVHEMANLMEVSTRSIYRYKAGREPSGCALCDITHSRDVLCKSDTYTVTCSYGQYLIVLNRHGRALARELGLVKYFVEYAFPGSTVERLDGSHDSWMLGRVELEEAKNFMAMCDALNRYTLSLSKGIECLQQAK